MILEASSCLASPAQPQLVAPAHGLPAQHGRQVESQAAAGGQAPRLGHLAGHLGHLAGPGAGQVSHQQHQAYGLGQEVEAGAEVEAGEKENEGAQVEPGDRSRGGAFRQEQVWSTWHIQGHGRGHNRQLEWTSRKSKSGARTVAWSTLLPPQPLNRLVTPDLNIWENLQQ